MCSSYGGSLPEIWEFCLSMLFLRDCFDLKWHGCSGNVFAKVLFFGSLVALIMLQTDRIF